MKTKYASLLEEKAVVMGGTMGGGGPQHTRKVSSQWVGSIWFFSGAFSSGPAVLRPLSGVGVQDLSQSVWVSQFEKGSCFLFLLSHSKKYKQKNPKPSTEVPRAWTCWFPSWARATWQAPPSPAAAAAVWGQTIAQVSTATAASFHSRLRHHCSLQFFTHHVSRPTGGIRNSKFSKQFQYFQYMLGIL